MTKEEKQEIMEVDILKEPMAIGQVFAQSGMFPDIKSQAQAVVKIMAGKELGLTPFQSMKSLYLVNGRLGIMADAVGSKVKQSGKYDYRVKNHTDQECTVEFYSLNGQRELIGESTYTLKDAAKAGIVNRDVWKAYPKNMLFSRALTNGTRWFCPDVICGFSTVEELQEIAPVKSETRVEFTNNCEVVTDGGINGEA